MASCDIGEFRRRFAGCEIVLLADVSTGTILAADSAIRLGQENFDRECATATRVFHLCRDAGPSRIRLIGPTALRVYARIGSDAPEILCGVFAPGAETSGFSQAAQAFAQAILSGGADA